MISTKVGRLLEPFDGEGLDDEGFAVPRHFRRIRDYSADGVRRSIESSLERLGTDRVEIVYIHDPDDYWDEAVSEAYLALEELRSQGVVGAIGVGMNQWEMPERFVRETDIDVVMLAGRYTLLEQPALASFLPACVDRGVSVVACGVFNSGLLSKPEVASTAKYNYEDAPAELVDAGAVDRERVRAARRDAARGGDPVRFGPPRGGVGGDRVADGGADDAPTPRTSPPRFPRTCGTS